MQAAVAPMIRRPFKRKYPNAQRTRGVASHAWEGRRPVSSGALMHVVNELDRNADFDEQSGRHQQQDAGQDGIWRCAFSL